MPLVKVLRLTVFSVLQASSVKEEASLLPIALVSLDFTVLLAQSLNLKASAEKAINVQSILQTKPLAK